ncbi:hypothetical protein CGUA_04025 [Corynebacterium guangdongense]|nr:hypothetical protein CGUA_04025 [Corynebacterium guangdongense]
MRPTSLAGRLRRFAPVVGIPEAVIVLTILVLALGGLMLSATPLAYFPLAVGEMWLVVTLAPVVIEGVTVSFLPMLPAIGLIGLLSYRIRRAIRARVSMIDLAVLLLCVILIPSLITGAAWLMVWDAAKVYPVEAPPLWEALLRTVVVHVTALVIGMGQRLWRAVARHYSVPPALVDGARDAWRFFFRLSVAALLLLLALLAFGWSRQAGLLAEFPDLSTSGMAALVALSLAYLPNAIIAAGAVLLGSEFHIGDASASLFSIHLVPLPPLPIAAAIPGGVAPWAPVLLLITAGVASWVMVTARPDVTRALGAAGGAALIAATATFLGGGELGWYGATGASLPLTTVLAAVWLGAIGVATAGALALTARRSRRAEQAEAGEGTADDAPEEDVEPGDTEPADGAPDETAAAGNVDSDPEPEESAPPAEAAGDVTADVAEEKTGQESEEVPAEEPGPTEADAEAPQPEEGEKAGVDKRADPPEEDPAAADGAPTKDA